jgi:hypothetical protein
MQLTITIHDSWATIPVALSRLLVALAALERPREPGEDLDDLRELLAGMDDAPEPAPSPAPAAAWAARPAHGRPSARPFEGTPTTGQAMYRWACDRKVLPKVNTIGRRLGYHKLVTHWDAEQVARVLAEMTTAEPTANGRTAH